MLATNPDPDSDPQITGSEVSDPDSDPLFLGSGKIGIVARTIIYRRLLDTLLLACHTKLKEAAITEKIIQQQLPYNC